MSTLRLHRSADQGGPGSLADHSDRICDERFTQQLRQVQDLKQFLFEEKVGFKLNDLESIDLGSLNNLRYSPQGRMPSAEEWRLLDEKMSKLSSYLTDDLRQTIRIRELSVFFGVAPLSFLVASLAILVFRFSYGAFLAGHEVAMNFAFLFSTMGWLVAQGGLGACAFLGTRAAARHLDKAAGNPDTSELTDKSFLKIRIILGCLFAPLIGIPFANTALNRMAELIYLNSSFQSATSEAGVTPVSFADFALIILPFIIGYSSNLVLAVFERSVASVRTFFGISSK